MAQFNYLRISYSFQDPNGEDRIWITLYNNLAEMLFLYRKIFTYLRGARISCYVIFMFHWRCVFFQRGQSRENFAVASLTMCAFSIGVFAKPWRKLWILLPFRTVRLFISSFHIRIRIYTIVYITKLAIIALFALYTTGVMKLNRTTNLKSCM